MINFALQKSYVDPSGERVGSPLVQEREGPPPARRALGCEYGDGRLIVSTFADS
jgi:hypothetical protein